MTKYSKNQILKAAEQGEVSMIDAKHIVFILDKYKNIPADIRDEMDANMEESGVDKGEIESLLNHWNNKFIIKRKK